MNPSSLSSFLLSIGGIILVDLILSGDNALVIGAAAAHIPQRRRRWLALVIGGLGAILLRIIFTTSTTFLLGVPYLQALGGLLILVIAIRLLLEAPMVSDKATGEHADAHPGDLNEQLPTLARLFSNWMSLRLQGKMTTSNWNFIMAIATITIADITMSLDNIVAIGALAHQQVVILAIGLILSIALLLIGSALVAELVSRIPWLLIIASFILAWVSSDLIWNDLHKLPFIGDSLSIHIGLVTILFAIILIVTIITRIRHRQAVKRSNDISLRGTPTAHQQLP